MSTEMYEPGLWKFINLMMTYLQGNRGATYE
jgi:hypothetical protein